MSRQVTRDRATIESIIERAQACRIAMCVDNKPYVVPVTFGYQDNCLYFHSSPQGTKIDILKQNAQVCFEMDIDHELIKAKSPCTWDIRYRSVIGFGTASFVEDIEEKQKALHIILQHYADGPFQYHEASLRKATVVKIEIESMTAKVSGY